MLHLASVVVSSCPGLQQLGDSIALTSLPAHPHPALTSSLDPAPPPSLQEVVASWGNYSELVQADLFTALQMPVAGGDWDQLEGRLQVALDLASLF